MIAEAVVSVPVTQLWSSPEAPRPVDQPVLADAPDHASWLAAMDAVPDTDPASRLGLDDRLLTELLEGEPVTVQETVAGWSRVTCPWQPSSRDEAGYPGWIRTAHLSSAAPPADAPAGIPAPEVTGTDLVDTARRHDGLSYLWGGLSPAGLDCSGLVHLVARDLGWTVPRDAHDQAEAATPVPVDQVQPGDLYFFARPGRSIHHVGFVVQPGVMLHAPQTGAAVVEEELSDARRTTLVSAGRIAPTQ
ncbi:C40 family peptidase [Metallococcus carri]|uniref:C40 family peptidase n=1 Tax=Metallococcus carri TaxID=1656884 RepID=UPI001A9E30BF|nr:C40 family peptidase [Metallococcus carri]